MKLPNYFITISLICFCLSLISWISVYNTPKAISSKSDSASYSKLIDEIKMKHNYISSSCRNIEKAIDGICIEKTEQLLINILYKQIIPQWIGTKWEFYGETQFPGDSSIACGHFVITTLKHLGVLMEDPHQMATNYSAYMVNSLCDTSYKLHKAADLIKIVKSKPGDIWVVGLRNHSGFIVNDQGNIRFVHSSYSMPDKVVNELADSSMIFQGSNIYVAGNLFVGNSLTQKWINNEVVKYKMKY